MDKIESILPYFIWIEERDEDEIDEYEISFFLRGEAVFTDFFLERKLYWLYS